MCVSYFLAFLPRFCLGDNLYADSKDIGKPQAPDLTHAQANIQAAGTRAGAYFSSWGSWASEKRKGWGSPKTPVSSPPPVANVDGRAEVWRKEKERVVGIGEQGSGVVGAEGEQKRRSLFFDAEGEGKDEAKVVGK